MAAAGICSWVQTALVSGSTSSCPFQISLALGAPWLVSPRTAVDPCPPYSSPSVSCFPRGTVAVRAGAERRRTAGWWPLAQPAVGWRGLGGGSSPVQGTVPGHMRGALAPSPHQSSLGASRKLPVGRSARAGPAGRRTVLGCAASGGQGMHVTVLAGQQRHTRSWRCLWCPGHYSKGRPGLGRCRQLVFSPELNR